MTRPSARRPTGGQGGFEPPVRRMRRDARILELALERWSQRRIAAEVGLSQVGVLKALRRILRDHAAEIHADVEAYRVKLLLLAERRGRAAREGHERSCQDVTTRRQRKSGAHGAADGVTTAEIETQSSAGNPHYLAVEQRCDEFAAQLLGLQDRAAGPVLPASAAIAAQGARRLGDITTDTLERVHADLIRPADPRPARPDAD